MPPYDVEVILFLSVCVVYYNRLDGKTEVCEIDKDSWQVNVQHFYSLLRNAFVQWYLFLIICAS